MRADPGPLKRCHVAGSDSDRLMDRPSGEPAIPDAAAFDAIGEKNWRSDAPIVLYFALKTANGWTQPGACLSPECGEGCSRVGSTLSGDMLPRGVASAAFVRFGRSPARLDGRSVPTPARRNGAMPNNDRRTFHHHPGRPAAPRDGDSEAGLGIDPAGRTLI